MSTHSEATRVPCPRTRAMTPSYRAAFKRVWACLPRAQYDHFSRLSRSISACNSLNWSCSALDFASSSSIFRCRASNSLDCDFSAFALASSSSTRRCSSISRAVGPAGCKTRAGEGSVGCSFNVTPPCPAYVGSYTESLCTQPPAPSNIASNPHPKIRNLKSEIPNLKSQIPNPHSFIPVSNKRPVRSTL
jgi:hypothetical protein